MKSKQRSATLKALQDRVLATQIAYERASRRFKVLTGDPVNGRSPEAQQAGEESLDALRKYAEALAALNNFEVHGFMPDDVKSKRSGQS